MRRAITWASASTNRTALTQTRDTLKGVSSRNITFNLPADLIRQAKIYAAAHDPRVNALVRELLDQKLTNEVDIRSAAARFLETAKSGENSVVDPASIHREELYDRR